MHESQLHNLYLISYDICVSCYYIILKVIENIYRSN